MAKENKKIFVIIVTYNGMRWYEHCFSSLRQSTIPVQTIVVDNASNDGTVEYIKEHFSEIILIESKENLGFGKANNLAMRYALNHDCDYVFLLNQDAWIEPRTIEQLVAVHKINSVFGVIAPMLMHVSWERFENGFLKYLCSENNIEAPFFSDIYLQKMKDVYEAKMLCAAAWLLPRNTLLTIGGFNPFFFHYGEDDDYIHRVHFHHMKVGLVPHAKVVHDGEREYKFEVNILQRLSLNNNLLLWLDINKKFIFSEELISFLSLAIKQLLKFKNPKIIFSQICFLIKNKSEIYDNRQKNMKKQPNWIFE